MAFNYMFNVHRLLFKSKNPAGEISQRPLKLKKNGWSCTQLMKPSFYTRHTHTLWSQLPHYVVQWLWFGCTKKNAILLFNSLHFLTLSTFREGKKKNLVLIITFYFLHVNTPIHCIAKLITDIFKCWDHLHESKNKMECYCGGFLVPSKMTKQS